MTNHIVSFSVGIDDDAIRENIMASAEQQIIREIKRDVLNQLFSRNDYWSKEVKLNEHGNVADIKDLKFKDYAKDILVKAIGDNKDAIIEKAAEMLVESYKRTKAWKEKVGEVIE